LNKDGSVPSGNGEDRKSNRTSSLVVKTAIEKVSGRRKEETRKRTGEYRREKGRQEKGNRTSLLAVLVGRRKVARQRGEETRKSTGEYRQEIRKIGREIGYLCS